MQSGIWCWVEVTGQGVELIDGSDWSKYGLGNGWEFGMAGVGYC